MVSIVSNTEQVIAIITEDGIDQIIPVASPDAEKIIRREMRDLRAMGCTVSRRLFPNEAAAYDWEEARR